MEEVSLGTNCFDDLYLLLQMTFSVAKTHLGVFCCLEVACELSA